VEASEERSGSEPNKKPRRCPELGGKGKDADGNNVMDDTSAHTNSRTDDRSGLVATIPPLAQGGPVETFEPSAMAMPGMPPSVPQREGLPGIAVATGSQLSESDPPLLIGGLRQEYDVSLLGAKVDCLTVTTPSFISAYVLMPSTEKHEDGYARQGFRQSERRTCMGGHCWRRWSPIGESKLYGLEYESWEWDGGKGGGSDCAADFLRPFEARPTRVDVAFDFSCSSDLTSIIVADHPEVQRHCAKRNIEADGVTGGGGVFTRYLASRNSDVFIRIYRKDLQNAVIAEMLGPVLRIEIIMKDDVARAWWAVWKQDKEKAYRAAAAHVLRLSSLRVLPIIGDIPELITPDTKATEALLPLFQQYSSHIVAAAECGIDVLQMAALVVGNLSRQGKHRHRKRVEQVTRQEPEELRSILTRMLS